MKKADIEELKSLHWRLSECEAIILSRIPKYREYSIADHIAYALTEIEDSLPKVKKKVKK